MKGTPMQAAATVWMEAPIDNDTMISHMEKHGVFDEAERVMNQLDEGTAGETLSAAEVQLRLARYLR